MHSNNFVSVQTVAKEKKTLLQWKSLNKGKIIFSRELQRNFCTDSNIKVTEVLKTSFILQFYEGVVMLWLVPNRDINSMLADSRVEYESTLCQSFANHIMLGKVCFFSGL